jgi:tetratricopeptide (TPR) repeat protein/predicted aspartyl protease
MRHFGYRAALAAFSLSTGIATANCQLQLIGSLPVDMHGLRPIVAAKINGVEARFGLDSGAFFSLISDDAAAQYQLSVTSVSTYGYYVRGMGGEERARMATVKSFEFLGMPLHNIEFLVVDQSFGAGYAGLIGQNLLRLSDVEYDLANGIVRFFKPLGCEQRPLAYWAVSTPYTAVALQPIDATEDHLRATAMVNGHRVAVWFDTGSPRSFLSLQAAERAGITPDSPGVTLLGLSGGIGPGSSKVWSAPVDSFQIGGEKVQHAHLLMQNLDPARRIGEVGDDIPDMLLGEDFFLSHRIYVAYGQRMLYFTYNGGPLFNLNLPQVDNSTAAPATSPDGAPQASAATAMQPGSDAPTDADGFRRRGLAYAAMREFGPALADLTRACELAPNDADDHYNRGVIYVEDGQVRHALQDFDTAITLQPNDIDAHLARAELLQSNLDTDPADAESEIKADLDAASRLAAPASGVRLTLGELYGRAGEYSAGIAQIDQWLSNHPIQNEQAAGLNERCWLRATADRDLHAALEDCNHALDLKPRASEETGSHISSPLIMDDSEILDSRGLVYLRLSRLQDAVHDYGSALSLDPKIPASLYGRGLAELLLGETAEGQADLAAATKLDSRIAKRFSDMGLAP